MRACECINLYRRIRKAMSSGRTLAPAVDDHAERINSLLLYSSSSSSSFYNNIIYVVVVFSSSSSLLCSCYPRILTTHFLCNTQHCLSLIIIIIISCVAVYASMIVYCLLLFVVVLLWRTAVDVSVSLSGSSGNDVQW